MAGFRSMRCALVMVVIALCVGGGVRAQSFEKGMQEKEVRELLVGQPLYLRGFWMGSALEFDGAGQPMGGPPVGPMTLSGVDVVGVAVKGKKMEIRADRVALVADEDGRLQRRELVSTTLIVPSLMREDKDEFKAKEEIRLIVHADAQGGFDAALKAIFVNGLAELATVAPPYWSCYAAGYFVKNVAASEAKKTVTECVREHALPRERDNWSYMKPEMLSELQVHETREAEELGLEGTSKVHFVVGPHGVPVRFMVERAVGAGLDEVTLQALSESRFKPAMKDGVGVATDSDFSIRYGERR